MEEYNVSFKKSLGQNFIKDNAIVEKIVNIAELDQNSMVVEVGPGGGILTKELADRAALVIAYEIDESLKKELSSRLVDYNNISVIYNDFLTVDIVKDLEKYEYSKKYFISNVPYYITTPILNKLISSKINFNKIIMMVQKEVGERLCAKSGTKSYGSISVFLNYYFDSKIEFFVGKENFVPQPKVDSVVVSFSYREREYLKDYKFFEKLVYDSFKYKRKTLKNNLKDYDLGIVSEVLKRHGFDLNVRAEQLDYIVFVEIANLLFKK